MKRSDLRKLTIAIASATMMASVAAPAIAYDVEPGLYLQAVQNFVEAGDDQDALRLLVRLQAIGVTDIAFNGQIVSVEDLAALIVEGSFRSREVFREIVRSVLLGGGASFVAGTTVVAAVDSDQFNGFPIGSTG
ncbi:hypothetical protein [Devosia sp. 1566]|uniref:hypothetical protein n=1 Tax=Devosia sp. 1566 TaxID=2499144 RepID=UPI000FDB7D09|nr:hypothetical protein [Devosia sp. 1566]